MSDVQSLISKLEAAIGPDRELDAEIFRAIGMPLPEQFMTAKIALEWNEAEKCFTFDLAETRVRYEQPSFTSSIDAAMTLTDPQSHLTIDRYVVSDKPNQMTWRVWIKKLIGDIDGDGPCGLQTTFATGPTIPLALCIAALSCGLY